MKNTPRIFVTGANGFIGSKKVGGEKKKFEISIDKLKFALPK